MPVTPSNPDEDQITVSMAKLGEDAITLCERAFNFGRRTTNRKLFKMTDAEFEEHIKTTLFRYVGEFADGCGCGFELLTEEDATEEHAPS